MPKDIHSPRDELICGAIDDAEDLAHDFESVALMDVLGRIRHMATRMEKKLISRKDEAEKHSSDAHIVTLFSQVIDIWDDGQNNPPESRCYADGSFTEVMDELRAAIAARGQS